MLSIFHKYTVTVLRPTYKVINGTRTADWSNPSRTPIENCAIQGGDSSEEHYRESSVTIEFTVFAPLDADIKASDRVEFEYAGRTYTNMQVFGEPTPIDHPLGIVSHTLVKLTKKTG